jgi:hypothetical protein
MPATVAIHQVSITNDQPNFSTQKPIKVFAREAIMYAAKSNEPAMPEVLPVFENLSTYTENKRLHTPLIAALARNMAVIAMDITLPNRSIRINMILEKPKRHALNVCSLSLKSGSIL